MRVTISNRFKILCVSVFVVLSIIGFMIKLPSGFRHSDKALHSLFYFIAAAFLNLLFSNKKLAVHLLIFGALYLFGVSIEHAQAYSNKMSHTRIHGRYDPVDVQSNLKGLIAFSILWVVYVAFLFGYNKIAVKEVVKKNESS